MMHMTWAVPQLRWFVTSLLLWRPGFTFWDRSTRMEEIWTSILCLVLVSYNTNPFWKFIIHMLILEN